jgi:TonB family protein
MHFTNHQKNIFFIYAFVITMHTLALGLALKMAPAEQNQRVNQTTPPQITRLAIDLQQTNPFAIKSKKPFVLMNERKKQIMTIPNQNHSEQGDALNQPSAAVIKNAEKVEPVEKKQISFASPKEIKKPSRVTQNQNTAQSNISPVRELINHLEKNKQINKEAIKESQHNHFQSNSAVNKKTTEEMKDVFKPQPKDYKTSDLDANSLPKIAASIPQATLINKTVHLVKPIPNTSNPNHSDAQLESKLTTKINTTPTSTEKNQADQKAKYLGEKPPYPDSSRMNEEEGSIELEVKISENGQLQNIKIIKSTGFYGLDTAVQTHLKKTKWRPAITNGQAHASTLVLRFIYELNE